MLTITGTVKSKCKKIRPVRAEIVIEDDTGDAYYLQLKPKNFDKLVYIDVGAVVSFTVKNELSKADKIHINNMVVVDAKINRNERPNNNSGKRTGQKQLTL